MSSKMPLSAEGSICDFGRYKKGKLLKKFRNRNLTDWRNWNKSLFGENLKTLILLLTTQAATSQQDYLSCNFCPFCCG